MDVHPETLIVQIRKKIATNIKLKVETFVLSFVYLLCVFFRVLSELAEWSKSLNRFDIWKLWRSREFAYEPPEKMLKQVLIF